MRRVPLFARAGFGQRQPEAECRAVIDIGDDPQRPAVVGDDGPADRQAHSHAAGLGRVVRLEYPARGVRLESPARIADAHDRATPAQPRADAKHAGPARQCRPWLPARFRSGSGAPAESGPCRRTLPEAPLRASTRAPRRRSRSRPVVISSTLRITLLRSRTLVCTGLFVNISCVRSTMWFARCASFATSARASRTSSMGPCESSHRRHAFAFVAMAVRGCCNSWEIEPLNSASAAMRPMRISASFAS